MKKLFIFLPVIFLLSFFKNSCLMSAYAFETSDFIGKDIHSIVADDFDQGYDDALSTFKSYEHILYFNGNNFGLNVEGRAYYYSFVLPITSSNTFTTSLSDDNSCYTIEFGSSCPDNCRVANYNFYYDSDDIITGYGGYSSFYNYFISGTSITRVEYYPQAKEIKFYNGDTVVVTVTDIFNVQSTIEDLPSSALDLEVTFNPVLSGNIDRILVSDDGTKYYGSGFKMTLNNKSSSAAQYRMAIFEGEVTGFGSWQFDFERAVYIYYTDEWYFGRDISTQSLTARPIKQYGPTLNHYIDGFTVEEQVFNWSQIDIEENTIYTVVVEASSSTFDCVYPVSDNVNYEDSSTGEYSLLYSNFENVYCSTFSVDYLGDITYNHDDDSNGIKPYNCYDDAKRLSLTRSAYVNEDGIIDYSDLNVYEDPNSWYNTSTFGSAISKDNKFVADDVTDISVNFSNFSGFIFSVFNLLPASYWNIFYIGFVALIIIGVIKVVK